MAKKNVWITKSDDGWKVKSEGAGRADSVHRRQSDAIERGRDMARDRGAELIIKGEDGKIRSKDSHGNDPRNVKG